MYRSPELAPCRSGIASSYLTPRRTTGLAPYLEVVSISVDTIAKRRIIDEQAWRAPARVGWNNLTPGKQRIDEAQRYDT